MTPARFRVILAVSMIAIIGIKIGSTYRSAPSEAHTPISVQERESLQVSTPSERSTELAIPPPGDSAFRPANSWTFAGSTSPKAAFESVFWAKEHMDGTALATLISISPEIRNRADQVLSSMTLTARSRLALHTPEALIAYLYATSPMIRAFRIGAEHEKDFQHSTIFGELLFENGRNASVELGFRLEAGGWRYILDDRNARDLLDNWQKVWKDPGK